MGAAPVPNPAAKARRSFLLLQIRFAALLWVIGGVIVGFLGAILYGEIGSIVLATAGVIIGISGAISHSILILAQFFSFRYLFARVGALWIGAMILPTVWILQDVLRSKGGAPENWRTLEYFGPLLGVPALLGAIAFERLVRKSASSD